MTKEEVFAHVKNLPQQCDINEEFAWLNSLTEEEKDWAIEAAEEAKKELVGEADIDIDIDMDSKEETIKMIFTVAKLCIESGAEPPDERVRQAMDVLSAPDMAAVKVKETLKTIDTLADRIFDIVEDNLMFMFAADVKVQVLASCGDEVVLKHAFNCKGD